MSLVFGMFDHDNDLDPDEVQRMVDSASSLKGEPVHTYSEPQCFLAYKRHLLTPQDQHEIQPLTFDKGRYRAVIDARLDGRKQLMADLNEQGSKVHWELPDSELVLAAYLQWGEACTDYLLGDFAIVIYDVLKKKLWCVRDHLGVVPFFYATKGSCVIFGQLPRLITSTRAVGSLVNYRYIANYLTMQTLGGSDTFFEGVTALYAGHSLSFSAKETKDICYWSLDINKESDKTLEESVEHLKELLEESVADRLRVKKKVSSMLSGGLDSSTISVLAARYLQTEGKTLDTYTYVPIPAYKDKVLPGVFVNEQPSVEKIINHQEGLKPSYVDLEGASIFDGLEEFLEVSGSLRIHNFNNRLWADRFMALASARDSAMMLTGQMGNFSISHAGPSYKFELAKKWQLVKLFRHLFLTNRRNVTVALSKWVKSVIATFIPVAALTAYEGRFRKYTFLNKQVKQSFLKEQGVDPLEYRMRLNSLKSNKPLMAFALASAETVAANYKAHEQIYGVRQLDPSADKRIVEFVLSLPTNYWSHKGQGRYLIRELTKGLLPDEVRLNDLKGRQLVDEPYLVLRDREEILVRIERWRRIPEMNQIFDFHMICEELNQFDESHVDSLFRMFLSKTVAVCVLLEKNLD